MIGEVIIEFYGLTYDQFQEVIGKFYQYLSRNTPKLVDMSLTNTLDGDPIVGYSCFVIKDPSSTDTLKIETIKRSVHSE